MLKNQKINMLIGLLSSESISSIVDYNIEKEAIEILTKTKDKQWNQEEYQFELYLDLNQDYDVLFDEVMNILISY